MREALFTCLEDHSALALAAGDARLAAGLASAAEMSRNRLGLIHAPRAARRWIAHLEALWLAADNATIEAAFAAGEAWEIDQAVRCALAVGTARSPG
jgi:hypothetical protein